MPPSAHRPALGALVLGLVLGLAAPSLAPTSAPAQPTTGACSQLLRRDRGGRFIARADLDRSGSVLDGDDLLARVDRSPTGALPPTYAPGDLVDLSTGAPARPHACTPPRRQCLRASAAEAYGRLAEAMEEAGHRPFVSSAFRAYRVQCATFDRWRRRDGMCEAAVASALPGHSQHQLGTALDLFTRDWNDEGRFRPGFGCDPGGRWIAAHAEEFGFVLPYPLHPTYRDPERPCTGEEERLDPRTGYRYEPWHLRYIGPEGVAAYRAARAAERTEQTAQADSELTVDQWLRAQDGVETTAPVCDGCGCDRCATFVPTDARGPCEHPAVRLTAEGQRARPADRPRLLEVSLAREGEVLELRATLSVPTNSRTLPPVVTPASGRFVRGRRAPVLAATPGGAYAPREGVWRLAIGFDGGRSFPWRAALAPRRRDGTANGLDAPFPAPAGPVEVVVPLAGVHPGTPVRVGLASGRRVEDVVTRRAP